MTIVKPPENILDKVLKIFGKARGVLPPENAEKIYGKYGPYVQIRGKKEGFFKALFGSGKKPAGKE